MPRARRACVIAALCGRALLGLIGANGAAHAQDMEPRAYSAAPIGTNFIVTNYSRTTGAVSLDPSLPIANVKASINTGALAYERTFDLFGQTASAAIAVPFLDAKISGDVFEASRQISRTGLGDIRFRFAENLIGGPSLTPSEFAQRQPVTTLGLSLSVLAPTGDYNPQHLVNISSHRWAIKPEIGVSQPLGAWFADVAAGPWFFTDNGDFFRGHTRGEDPLWTVQAHTGYNFRPGLWLAVDATHYFGGQTILDGVNKHDFESATRYGVTLSLPLAPGWAAKVAWASWLTAHNGGGYDTLTFALQYRWFD